MSRGKVPGRAADIADLEKMLYDGEDDAALCNRAIEIFERLYEDVRQHQYSTNTVARRRIEEEALDFRRVIHEIEAHRHEHVLDKFKEFLNAQPD